MSALIIFDCDGVLVESEVIYVEVEHRAIMDAGVSIDREDYIRRYSGLPTPAWRKLIAELIVTSTGTPVADGFFEELSQNCYSAFEEKLTSVPGAREYVSALADPVCVASSSGTKQLHWKLRHTGLHDLFAPHIYSTDLVQNGKPAPDLFLHGARDMAVAPDQCIVIEDSANGVLAGKSAGMKVIGFVGAGHCLDGHGDMLAERGADLVLDDFAHLDEAIAELKLGF